MLSRSVQSYNTRIYNQKYDIIFLGVSEISVSPNKKTRQVINIIKFYVWTQLFTFLLSVYHLYSGQLYMNAPI